MIDPVIRSEWMHAADLAVANAVHRWFNPEYPPVDPALEPYRKLNISQMLERRREIYDACGMDP